MHYYTFPTLLSYRYDHAEYNINDKNKLKNISTKDQKCNKRFQKTAKVILHILYV